MEGTAGSKTLRDIFVSDAQRYGTRHHRGILSAYWAYRYQELGGDLYETFRDTLPHDDLVLIRVAQRGGAGALEQTLRDVAALTRVIEQARQTFVSTVAVGLLALLVMCATLLAVPGFTVPRLKQAFGMVPDEFVGALTRHLYALADAVRLYGCRRRQWWLCSSICWRGRWGGSPAALAPCSTSGSSGGCIAISMGSVSSHPWPP